MDVFCSQIIAVRKILVLWRSLQLPAQTDPLPVFECFVVRCTDEDQAAGRQIAITCIYSLDFYAQVGIGIAIIRRFSERACDQQVILAVVVKGDMECIEFGNGVLITGCTEKQAKEKDEGERAN